MAVVEIWKKVEGYPRYEVSKYGPYEIWGKDFEWKQNLQREDIF
jgi:hypothetical protein